MNQPHFFEKLTGVGDSGSLDQVGDDLLVALRRKRSRR